MPRVKIDTPGVSIELDANEASIKDLGDQALQLSRDAVAVDVKVQTGPAYGFSAERRYTDAHEDVKSQRGRFDEVKA